MIAVVDYGMGNLRSVQKAVLRVGGDAQIIQSPSQFAHAEKIILPGVGAFVNAMERLSARQLIEPLLRAAEQGTPLLGICLGLQLMFDISYEGGETTGLGILPGKAVRFQFHSDATGQSLRVPHMGWNTIHWSRPCPLTTGLESGAYVYFAHSYHVVPINANTATTTEYGYDFTSAVWKDNIFGTQFHPEKSQSVGLKILENFVGL
ncbi:MAG: imidazole glycerol phosphate synthase subunit HisH [Planctomycetota bacterium]|nr:imidazole glycerol phosphate synthase subunit HisH [Planctomycetota bacterium]